MKKIVILHPDHWEQSMGGAEIQISYIITYLKKLGFEIHFIYENNYRKINNRDKINLHPIKRINLTKSFGPIYILYYFSIRKVLHKIRPDFIYTRTYTSWSGIASSYAKNKGIKHIWAIASDSDLKKKIILKHLLHPFHIIEYIVTNRAFRLANFILTQNTFQNDELHNRYARTSIKVNQMTPTENVDKIRKSGKIKIVWIANLKHLKRPDLFLKIAEEFNNYDNCEFLMIGRMAPPFINLIKTAQQKISNFIYLGKLSNQHVNSILCKSDILVNTSDYEGFSNTFVQAWMRKVIVLSMHSNPDNIITENKIGFMCRTIEEMKLKIKLLIDNHKLRKTMAVNAYHYALKNHSIHNNINKITSIII